MYVQYEVALISFCFYVHLQPTQRLLVKRILFHSGQFFLGFVVSSYFDFNYYSLSLLNVLLPYLPTILSETGTLPHQKKKAAPTELASHFDPAQ